MSLSIQILACAVLPFARTALPDRLSATRSVAGGAPTIAGSRRPHHRMRDAATAVDLLAAHKGGLPMEQQRFRRRAPLLRR